MNKWMNKKIKKEIRRKQAIYSKKICKNGRKRMKPTWYKFNLFQYYKTWL